MVPRALCSASLFLLASLFATSASLLLPLSASALESPKEIGYFCEGTTTSITEGQFYLPEADPCTYQSASLGGIDVARVGQIYRGTIASSTLIKTHGLGSGPSSSQLSDVQSFQLNGVAQGEDLFVVIFQERPWLGSYDSDHFRDFFTTGSTPAPHQNYGFIRWKYGTPPPSNPDPVIIIPGILGSEQKSDGTWVIDPILHTYDDLIATLDENGYTPGQDLFPFPYNWRKSNVETALLLKDKINQVKSICNCDKVDIVAHSMGGLVARQYIQSDSYEHDVDQLIFLGTPHLGAPKAYLMWEGGEYGPGFFSFLLVQLLEHEAAEHGYTDLFSYIRTESIDSVRQLLPIYDYIFDGAQLRVYPTEYPANTFLESLNSEIDRLNDASVEIHNIIGNLSANETISGLTTEDSTQYLPKWQHGFPRDLIFSSGDGTVPTPSASRIVVDKIIDTAEHSALVALAEGDVFEILSGKQPEILVHEFGFPDVKILLLKILSPADLLIIAPDGKKIGKENGKEINEIPGAFYSGFTTNTEYITIINPLDGEYKVFTEGTDSGPYTVETAYISNSGVEESSFTGNTVPGLITELNVPIDNENPNPDIAPSDATPPVITIHSPETRDYLRSEMLHVSVSAEDAGTGLHYLATALDNSSAPIAGDIDLFFLPLGTHTLSATATDNVNNASTTSRVFRSIANATSTRSDLSRSLSLAWMTQSIYDDLLKQFNACYKKRSILTNVTKTVTTTGKNGKPKTTTINEKVTTVEIYFDKKKAQDMLKTLDKHRGRGLTEDGYRIIREDVVWLMDN